MENFPVNAVGALNLMSSNKVYCDTPNDLPLEELSTRWDCAHINDFHRINECHRIDQSMHSVFGASQAAADLLTQEYGRTCGMPTVCFQAGCLTRPQSGVDLHGFVSDLVKGAVSGRRSTICGYKGRQCAISFTASMSFERLRTSSRTPDCVPSTASMERAPTASRCWKQRTGSGSGIHPAPKMPACCLPVLTDTFTMPLLWCWRLVLGASLRSPLGTGIQALNAA